MKGVYRLAKTCPPEERYGLALQMRRAAVSVSSNIAEGQARRGTKVFAHFLGLASGSTAELETQLLLSIDLGYVKRADAAQLEGELAEVQRMAAEIQRKLALRCNDEWRVASKRFARPSGLGGNCAGESASPPATDLIGSSRSLSY